MNQSFLYDKGVVTGVISVLQILIVVIPFKWDLFRTSTKKLSTISNAGWVLLFCCYAVIIFSLGLYNITERDEKLSEQKLQNLLESQAQQYTRELNTQYNAHAKQIGQSKDETINLLARYGLRMDSANNQIVKLIRDSSKKVTNILGSDPDLDFCPEIGITLKEVNAVENGLEYKMDIVTCAFESGAYNVNLSFVGFGKTMVGEYDVGKLESVVLLRNGKLSENTSLSEPVIITGRRFSKIFILIHGNFENSQKKTFSIRTIGVLDIGSKKFGISHDAEMQRVDKIFKEFGY